MPTCSVSGRSITATPTGRKLPLPDGRAALQPGLQHRQHRSRKTPRRCTRSSRSSSSSARCPRTWWSVHVTSRRTSLRSTCSSIPTALLWQDDNDFQVVRPHHVLTLVTDSGSYKNFLPNLDFDIGLSDSLKARFSYSKTIARAGYGTLAAGQNAGGAGWFDASTASCRLATRTTRASCRSSPTTSTSRWSTTSLTRATCRWVRSRRTSKTSSVTRSQQINLFGIRNQTGGPSRSGWRSRTCRRTASPTGRLGAVHGDGDVAQPGHVHRCQLARGPAVWPTTTARNAQHVAFATKYDILPTANDPLYTFNVNTPVNNQEAKIHGFEFGGQYFFGESGFGVLANYTIVRGDIGYDVTSDPNVNQFALTGLSDSANAVLMFEKFGLSARLAYNWRDEFLSEREPGWFQKSDLRGSV